MTNRAQEPVALALRRERVVKQVQTAARYVIGAQRGRSHMKDPVAALRHLSQRDYRQLLVASVETDVQRELDPALALYPRLRLSAGCATWKPRSRLQAWIAIGGVAVQRMFPEEK